MPYIKVTGGSLTAEQKELLIKRLTPRPEHWDRWPDNRPDQAGISKKYG